MPLYDFICDKCGKSLEILTPMGGKPSVCCGEVMTRKYSMGKILIKEKYPLWIDRIDDIHKRESQNGERLRFVHPSEVF